MLNVNSPTPKRADIGHIPPEILSEIFIHCLPIDSASQETQQLLSSVCRRWHALALATPALWASLIITYDIDTLYPPLPVIRTHIQRSGIHPLSFSLRVTELEHYRSSDHPHLLSVLTTLAAVRYRWDNVKIGLFRMMQNVLDLITQVDALLLQGIQYGTFGFPHGFFIPLSNTRIPLPSEWAIPLSALIERSRPTLHKLSLFTDQMSRGPTIVCTLALTPLLHSLILTKPTPLIATLIHALHPQSQPGAPLCPHLRILALFWILDCPDGLCTAMLRARWGAQAHANGVACLEAAYLMFGSGMHDRDESDMKELCAEGMKGVVNR